MSSSTSSALVASPDSASGPPPRGPLTAPLGLFLLATIAFLWKGDEISSAAAMFVLLFAVVRFARRAFDARTSVLTGVVLATSVGAILAARVASPDALLAACVTVASISLIETRTGASRLAWLAPVIGLALVTGAALRASEGDGPLSRLGAGAFRGTVPSTAAGLALALAPWVVFLPSVAVHLARDAAARGGAVRTVLCCLVAASAFGLSAGLRVGTLALLVLPWTSLLVARFWAAALDAPGPDTLRRTVGLPFAGAVLALPAVAWLARDHIRASFGVSEALATQGCVFLLFLSIGLFTFVIYRHTLLRFGGLAAASLLTLAFMTVWVAPRLDGTRGGGAIQEALRHVRPACEVRTAGLAGRAEVLALGEPGLADLDGEELVAFLASEARVYCLMDYSLFASLASSRTSNLHLVLTRPARGGSLALVTNRPERKGRPKEDP